MTLPNFLSFLRALFALVGSYLVGHAIFGHTVTADLWQVIAGTVITIASTVWGMLAKTATIEAIESAVRSLVASIGGFLASSGVISNTVLVEITGVVVALMTFLQSALSKAKTQEVAKGTLAVSATTGLSTTVPSGNPPPPKQQIPPPVTVSQPPK